MATVLRLLALMLVVSTVAELRVTWKLLEPSNQGPSQRCDVAIAALDDVSPCAALVCDLLPHS